MDFFDIIIVGGGIVGCMTARYLSQYKLKILLIEKEADIGMGSSSANSACIHSGHDPIPGTLKARMNRKGNPLWTQLSVDLGIPFMRSGAFVVATSDEEFTQLVDLKKRGEENKVQCEIIGPTAMHEVEPRINPQVKGALSLPTAGIVDPFGATLAACENAIQNGVTVQLETALQGFILDGSRKIVGIHTNLGDYACRWVINSAGMFSDDIMHMLNIRPDFKITARRGEYYILDKADFQIDITLFPVPSPISKGILVVGSLHGNPIVGPNAESTQQKEDTSVTPQGMSEVWAGAQKLVPDLSLRSVISTFAGLRATGNARCKTPGINYDHDFIIEIAEEVDGLINLAGIESPGFTAAPAIAMEVVELLRQAGEKLTEKQNWNPVRPLRPIFRHMSRPEQVKLVSQSPSYGRVICRCEMVTEGEIVAEIHSPIPARTYDAIKRRTWLGTGRCQGGFDMPRVVDILARECNISPLEVTKKGKGSEFLVRETKQVEG